MNTARWMLAFHLMQEKDQRQLRTFGKLLGALFTDPHDEEKAKYVPLSMFMNPDVYHKVSEKIQNSFALENDVSPVEDEHFEKAAQAVLAGSDPFETEIEDLFTKADTRKKEIEDEKIDRMLRPHLKSEK